MPPEQEQDQGHYSITGEIVTEQTLSAFRPLCKNLRRIFLCAFLAPRGFGWDGSVVGKSAAPGQQTRLDQGPESMRIRRQTVEHAFGTIKSAYAMRLSRL